MKPLLKEIRHNRLLWLLVFVPVVFAVEASAPSAHTALFVLSVLAVVPLAALLSHATESVSAKAGDTVGGLLNSTLGNLTELVIALAALRAGLHDVVKASIAGSIVGNILLVLGAAMVAGGLRHPEQHFDASGARSQATLLTLAAIALILPAAYNVTAGGNPPGAGLSERVHIGRAPDRVCPVPRVLAGDPQRPVLGFPRARA